MKTAKSKLETHADLLARDINGQIILLVKIQAENANFENVQQLISTWQRMNILIPFVMFVDLVKIWIYKQQEYEFSQEPIHTLETVEVLHFYDEDFEKKRIFKPYLTTLVEAWLRDLAYNWKLENPPQSDPLSKIGMFQKLKGGTTESDVDLTTVFWELEIEEVSEIIKANVKDLLLEHKSKLLNLKKIKDDINPIESQQD